MVTLGALWLPILLSALFVWIASAVFWTVSPHHKTDFRVVPDQDDFLQAVGKHNLSPGQYWFPYSTDPKEMQKPEMIEKMERGPVGLLTVMPSGRPNMGKAMAFSFVQYLVIAIVVAYIAGRTLEAGSDMYWPVFRVAGTVAFVAHSGGIFAEAIWFGQPWSRTWKTALDGLVYGALTAGAFGGFWPEG